MDLSGNIQLEPDNIVYASIRTAENHCRGRAETEFFVGAYILFQGASLLALIKILGDGDLVDGFLKFARKLVLN